MRALPTITKSSYEVMGVPKRKKVLLQNQHIKFVPEIHSHFCCLQWRHNSPPQKKKKERKKKIENTSKKYKLAPHNFPKYVWPFNSRVLPAPLVVCVFFITGWYNWVASPCRTLFKELAQNDMFSIECISFSLFFKQCYVIGQS